eukprot:Sspe_Gene.11826::Locus_4014_Transcript_3_3_Confidence_0.600_Length_1205::g.11826::m.11826
MRWLHLASVVFVALAVSGTHISEHRTTGFPCLDCLTPEDCTFSMPPGTSPGAWELIVVGGLSSSNVALCLRSGSTARGKMPCDGVETCQFRANLDGQGELLVGSVCECTARAWPHLVSAVHSTATVLTCIFMGTAVYALTRDATGELLTRTPLVVAFILLATSSFALWSPALHHGLVGGVLAVCSTISQFHPAKRGLHLAVVAFAVLLIVVFRSSRALLGQATCAEYFGYFVRTYENGGHPKKTYWGACSQHVLAGVDVSMAVSLILSLLLGTWHAYKAATMFQGARTLQADDVKTCPVV